MPRLRVAAPHGPRALQLSGGRSRRFLSHNEGAVPTDDDRAEWSERFPDRSKEQLRGLERSQGDVLKRKAAKERELPVRAPRLSACPA
jgi:hypothetical protein